MGTGTEAYLWRLLSASDHISPSIARIRSTAPSCQGIDVSASDSFQWALTFVGDPAKSYFFAISIHQIIGLEFPGGASLTNSPVFFRKPQDRVVFQGDCIRVSLSTSAQILVSCFVGGAHDQFSIH